MLPSSEYRGPVGAYTSPVKQTPLRAWCIPGFILLATCFAVFVAPFIFPPPVRSTVSVANAAGFNNRLAVIAAATLAVTTFVVAFLHKQSVATRIPAAAEAVRLPKRLWITICLLITLCIASASFIIRAARIRYERDAAYFINQMRNHELYHLRLWSQVEFPYGPLLFYPPVLLHRLLSPLQVSMDTCYFATLAAEQVVGVLLLTYILNMLPLGRRLRVLAFCISVMLTCQPLLGLNYTLMRFLAAPAALLFCIRRGPRWLALSFALGQLFTLSVSPEVGFAFAAGALAYVAVRMRSNMLRWAGVLLALLFGAAIFFRGRGELRF